MQGLRISNSCYWLLLALALVSGCGKANHIPAENQHASQFDLSTLLAASVQELDKYPIANLNLACTEGLLAGSDLGFTNELQNLEAMVQKVGSETERHLYRFKQNPADFEQSEGFFRMVMMGVVWRTPLYS